MEAVSISSSDCRWALGDHGGSPDRMSDWDDGAPVRAPVQLPNTKVAEKTMVFGRYNELVHGGYNGI